MDKIHPTLFIYSYFSFFRSLCGLSDREISSLEGMPWRGNRG